MQYFLIIYSGVTIYFCQANDAMRRRYIAIIVRYIHSENLKLLSAGKHECMAMIHMLYKVVHSL